MRVKPGLTQPDQMTYDFSTSILGHEAHRNTDGCLATPGHRVRMRSVSFSDENHKHGSMQPIASGYSLSSLSLNSDLSRESVGLSKLLNLTDTKQVRFSDGPRTIRVSEMDKPKSRRSSLYKPVHMQQLRARSHKESHPACRGPDIAHNVFNLSGLSPLVQNYLQRQNAVPAAGQDVLMQRTEVKNLIPSSVPTYSELVRQGYKRLQALDSVLKNTYENREKESLAFKNSLHEAKNELLRQNHFLVKKNEMKKLNQLILPSSKACARRRVTPGFRK